MKTIEIKHRFTDALIYSHTCEDNDIRTTVLAAITTEANLTEAYLSEANLLQIRADFWRVLLENKHEVDGLLAAINEGRIDGSQYEGKCSCLKGTIATCRGNWEGLIRDPSEPAGRWFLAIRKGDTPETSQVSKITKQWIEEFQRLIA